MRQEVQLVNGLSCRGVSRTQSRAEEEWTSLYGHSAP